MRGPNYKSEEERQAGIKSYRRKYYLMHREKLLQYNAEYRKTHPDYYKNNKDVILFKKSWKYRSDPAYRQKQIERTIKCKKKKKICQILVILGNLVSHKNRQSSTNTRK